MKESLHTVCFVIFYTHTLFIYVNTFIGGYPSIIIWSQVFPLGISPNHLGTLFIWIGDIFYFYAYISNNLI